MSNSIKTSQQHATAIADAEELLAKALRDAAEAGLIIECQVDRFTHASGGRKTSHIPRCAAAHSSRFGAIMSRYLVEHSDVSYSGNLVNTLQQARDLIAKKEKPDDGYFYVFEITRIWKATKPPPELMEIPEQHV